MLTDKRTLGFKDVLISPSLSDIKSRKDVSLERTFTFRNGLQKTFCPVVAANMANIGSVRSAITLSKYKMLTCLTKDYEGGYLRDFFGLYPETKEYCIPTFGLNNLANIIYFQSSCPTDIICLDVANGYMKEFVNYVRDVKDTFPDKIIIAGNVATAEGAKRLYEAGADIIKAGIGSGSVCTTRYKTGVGVPQIETIDQVKWCMYNRHDVYICSDGGCTGPGDVAKAFVAGADFVMIGGLLAGTKETGSVHQGSAYTPLRDGFYKTSEGKRVDFKEPIQSLDERLQDILGGLRSCGSYIGFRRIEDFYKAELIQVQEQTNNLFGPPA
jgi:GMP reductase